MHAGKHCDTHTTPLQRCGYKGCGYIAKSSTASAMRHSLADSDNAAVLVMVIVILSSPEMQLHLAYI